MQETESTEDHPLNSISQNNYKHFIIIIIINKYVFTQTDTATERERDQGWHRQTQREKERSTVITLRGKKSQLARILAGTTIVSFQWQ